MKDIYLPGRRAFLFVSRVNAGDIPQAQPINASVDFGAVEYNPAGGNQAEEYIELFNTNTVAVDLSGWRLNGGVSFTFIGGTVVPAGARLYVSPDVKAFRARTISPKGGERRLVVGPYHGQLSARGETILLSDPTGRLVASNSYVGNPSLAQQFLRISELRYTPPPLSGDAGDAREFEFIEFRNISANVPLDLTGVHFTNGLEFSFTGSAVTNLGPQERVLIVKNLAAFAARYGEGFTNVAGAYTGYLNNGGERITLLDAANEEVLDFSYNNSWHSLTDGPGFSLVIVDESAQPDAWGQASQWRPSAYDGGSPGAPDPAPIPIAPVLVNEILAYPVAPAGDAIELFNPNWTTVNLSYWYLTDDHNTPKKYLIAPGTSIAPFRCLVFSEASSFGVRGSINALGLVNDAFGLSSAGEEVYVYSGDSLGHLTGYYQGFSFGASAQGVTFGPYANSLGEVDIVAQSVPTLGLTNAYPLVGPVIIGEIMYEPPDLFVGGVRTNNMRDEFIELRSLTNAPVPLYDIAHPTNTWQIRNGVSFGFPMGVTLSADGFALVVGFDPVLDPVSLGAFRGRYGLSTNVPIYGPYAGHLDDLGAQVELCRPGTPDAATGLAPLVLVDRVHYGVTNPWPATASGTGASLQRKVLTGFGNDPTNWFAAGASAGADYVSGIPPTIAVQPSPMTAAELSSPSFSVSAGGTGPFFYQWYYSGRPIDGAYGSALVLTNVQLGQAGNYSVLVLSGSGSVQSSNAHLTVLPLPIITQQPVSTNVPPKGTASFRAAAIGTGPLSYQWQLNGTNVTNNGTTIVGATTNTLVLTNLLYDSAGAYQVLVTDSIGTRVSQAATLGVMQKPVITNQPPSVSVAVGQTAILSLGVDGTPPFYCRWRRNAQTLVPIGSNLVTLTLTNVVLTNGGTYDVVVTNLAAAILGGTAYAKSSNVYVNVVQPPTNQVAPPGTNVTLRAMVGGPISFTNRFWWFSNDTVIRTGSNGVGLNWILFTNDLVLTNVTAAQSGRYTFLLSNAVITSVTNVITNTLPWLTNMVSVTNYPVPPAAFTATLVVGYAPLIGQQPSNQTALAGTTVSFNVLATGSDPLGYQWQFNGQVLAGQTGPGLTLSQVQASQSGGYSVIVTNPAGGVTSQVAVLTVLFPPVILQQPTNQTVDVGTNAMFGVVADGTAPLTYQWWFNASNMLVGANDVTLLITNVQATNLGTYQVVVSNALGVITSLVATLSLPEPPAITQQPLDQNVLPGSNAVFGVVATGAEPLSYQWWFNATNAVTGGNGSTLTLTNAQWANGGGYQVLVSNRMGVATSQTASLVVVTSDQVKLQNVVMPAGPEQAVTIRFSGLAGLGYTVQYRDELNTGDWLVLTNVTPSGVNQTLTVQDWEAAAKPQRFYRIVTPMRQP
ncbi:MAG: immunoglobulin domain-containing protein [Verrucomicrobia bacterium]|nr:immunoglobulin domain-containing protein [Verrucomicrobiota bacterium]